MNKKREREDSQFNNLPSFSFSNAKHRHGRIQHRHQKSQRKIKQ
jgi:hypothetical protein